MVVQSYLSKSKAFELITTAWKKNSVVLVLRIILDF